MPISELSAVERIARVRSGRHSSGNAEGDEAHAGADVDLSWHDYLDDIIAILRTLREPDIVMANAGDADVWRAMVEATIQDYADDGEVATGGAVASPLEALVMTCFSRHRLGTSRRDGMKAARTDPVASSMRPPFA